MRAGYQDKPDAMREKADQLMNHPGSAPDVIYGAAPYNANKEKTRIFKKGGAVKNKKCFAMGGVGKIRHNQATKEGKSKSVKSK